MGAGQRFKPRYGLDGNSLTLTNLADPVNAQDGVTKNYLLSVAKAFLATQSFNGNTSTPAMAIINAVENFNAVAAAPTATQNVYAASGDLQYFTVNASANWVLNFAWSAGTTMNAALAVNQSVTIVLLVQQGATPYYPTAFEIDGTVVTPKWLGAVAPTAGTANGIDIYSFSILKTAASTYTVLSSQSHYG